MADTSLDDFFAKKDKSKKKTKSKKTDVDDVSKVKKKEKKKDKDNIGGDTANTEDAEEWKDFEEEKEVDLKGLRIQNMQISKDDGDKEVASAEDDNDSEDGENTEKKRGAAGPWNKTDTQSCNRKKKAKKEKKVEPPPTPEPVKEETSAVPKSTGKYVPPGARFSSAVTTTPSNLGSRRKKEAPNMNSEDDFPTLGGGLGGPRSYSSSNSGDLIDNPRGRAGNVTLENRFATLQD